MVILAVAGMAVMLVDLVLKPEQKPLTAWLALGGFVAAGVASLSIMDQRGSGFSGMVALDPYAQVLGLVAIIAGGFTVLTSFHYVRDRGIGRSEYYALLLFSVSGMVMMAAANNLIVVFVALELLSIPLYVLAGFARPNLESEEAAIKYFLLGAFASGFLLFGVALMYGALGTTDLAKIAALIPQAGASPLLLLGAAFVLIGLGFKVAAVPFHMWTPDVYEGAPTPITGFMSVGAKAAGFAALLRVFNYSLGGIQSEWVTIVAILAALTMIVGNIVAVSQNNLKRMLAYSSISHAGYLLLGLVAGTAAARTGMVFYLVVYLFMNMGAFGLLTVFGLVGERTHYDDLRGLGWKRPGMAIAIAVCMFSLAGIPPTAGFYGKYMIFKELVATGHLSLAIIGVLASLVSVYYYLRVLVALFLDAPRASQEREDAERPAVHAPLAGATILACAFLVMLTGLLQPWMNAFALRALDWIR